MSRADDLLPDASSEPGSPPSATASFVFELAKAEDDQSLRAVLAATPMLGHISIGFQREPSFLAASVVEGRFRQTIVVRDRRRSDRVIGMGSRSVSTAYLNDCPQPVGYLSGLRLLPEYRGGTLVARGYRFLRRLHQDGRASLYVTTIAEGNRQALAPLTSGRAGLPRYHAAGTYHTLMLPRSNGRPAIRQGGVDIRPASAVELPQLVAFWNRVGPQRQCFPLLTEEDFTGVGALYRDLAPSQILTAWRGATLCGTLAIWNQRCFRQSVVFRLPAWLRLARPLYNLLALAGRRPALPAVGNAVSYVTAALSVIEHDDPQIWRPLLAWATSRHLFPKEKFLAVGLHARDPLLSCIPARWALRYLTRVYFVCWEDGELLRRSLDQRPLYLELGRL